MSNIDLFNKYEIKKNGLVNGSDRQCICGKNIGNDENTCPVCGNNVVKSKLLNVAKNNAIAKRFEKVKGGNNDSLKYYHLLSNGFDLYETEVLNFSINKTENKVYISDNKIFKSISKKDVFIEWINEVIPGFLDYINKGLSEFQYEYAVSNFGSMTSDQIENYLNVYCNYKQLMKYLRGYKVFYYGKLIDLKKYYPNIDFNNEKEVENSGLLLKLLLTWDIKNVKYIEKIIDISNNESELNKAIILDIVDNMIECCNDRNWRNRMDYNDMIDSFSILYNDEISLEDFIRIYNNSRDNMFCKIYEFRKLYKKLVDKNIDWSSIEKIDSKVLGMLNLKDTLKKEKYSKSIIEQSYEELNKNPINALNILANNIPKK